MGKLLIGRTHSPQLAPDPRPARGAPLRRRSRSRASEASRPRVRIQGVRSAALRRGPGRSQGEAQAIRSRAATGWAGALRPARLAEAADIGWTVVAAAAAAGRP